MSRRAEGAGGKAGRFELQRLLGRGAQASVWLARDPKLGRDVALKRFDRDADSAQVSHWLHEAQAVAALTHPHIVPVFEADDTSAEPWLVFEFVDGPTLAEVLRRDGALPARRVVELMLGVLDALAAAHRQGIVHRDLKPSNVLLGADGRARVMDFGIAARVAGPSDGLIVGTAGYISPEAARGEAPSPAMDVFSAGVMLAELLTGRRPLAETDPMLALQRVQREDLMVDRDVPLDDGLRSIVQRALARDPARRHAGAAELRDALAQWQQAQQAAEPVAGGGHGTLDFLLRRMRHRTDFPALGDAVVRIQRAASSESASLGSLSAEILRDVALTNKLLRLVNSAHFSHAGGGSIATVSRAVALIGFAGVRNLALSLVVLEHMQNKSHAALLKEEFLRALMAGALAGELAMASREAEEVFIGAMFQNLGRLLTEFYFPEEAQQIRQLCSGSAPLAREEAAGRVLGINYDELGQGVARSWGLPDTLQRAMRIPAGVVPRRLVDRGVERHRWYGRCANEMTDAMLLAQGAEERQHHLAPLADAYAPALGLGAREILGACDDARGRLAELAQAMGVDVGRHSVARRLMGAQAEDTAQDRTLVLEPSAAALPAAAPPTPAAVAERLTAGIASLTETLAHDDFRLNDVLRMVLETIFGALRLQRVVFCLRDPRSNELSGRFGLGLQAEAVCKQFRVPLGEQGGVDLFGALCRKGADTLIADTASHNFAARLPEWYRRGVNAPTFLLLPLSIKGAPFGLIYADAGTPGAIEVGEKELSLLRALRNQVVMAARRN